MRLLFDAFELDTERRLLAKNGEELDLEPRVFDVLAYLSERADRVVSKEELLDELWGDRFVSESALSTAVKHARRAVGDSGVEQRIIKTVHGRGFRLVADVKAEPHQLIEESSPRAQPAQRAGRVSRIPRLVPLLGREDDLERLRSLLEPSAVVSIVGPGGVGKTSLAVAIAHELAASGQDSVWFCKLAVQTDEGVAARVLSVVDNTAGTGEATVERLVERIGDGPATLVLDNCEHLLVGVRAVVEELLDRLGGLTIITTSREVLGTSSERVVRLSGLQGGELDSSAVELVMRRGTEQGVVDDSLATRQVVMEVADRLEGLPLALELAASRLASMTPSELLEALDDQLGVLRRESGLDRHSTMEQTIAWSFDLLSREERRVLVELSVFRSPFRREAATEVLQIEGLGDCLHRLVQRSMLVRSSDTEGTRFRLLEPINQFVNRRTDGERLRDLTERHACYFARRVSSLVDDLSGPGEPVAAAALTAEWPDIAGAVRWGLAANRADVAVQPLVDLGFHIRWQQRTEAYLWLEEALGRLDMDPALRRDALVVVALAAWTDGDVDRLEVLHDRARAIGPTGVRGALLDLFFDIGSGDPTRFRGRADDLLAAAEIASDAPWVEIAASFRLAAWSVADPDHATTAQVAAELERIGSQSAWPSGRSWALLAKLTWAVRRGQVEEAQEYSRDLATASEANRTPFFVQAAGPLLGGLGRAGIEERLDRAAESVRLLVTVGEKVNYSLAFRSAAIALHAAGHLATAARITGFADEIEGGGQMAAAMTPEYDDVLKSIRASLGADEFAHLRQLGRRLDAMSAAELVVERSSLRPA